MTAKITESGFCILYVLISLLYCHDLTITALCRLLFSGICLTPFCHPFYCTMESHEVAFPLSQTFPSSLVTPKGWLPTEKWTYNLCLPVLRETIQVSKELIPRWTLWLSSDVFLNLDHNAGTQPLQSRCGSEPAAVLRDAGDSQGPESRFPYTAPFPGLPQQVIASIVPKAVMVPRYTILYVCSLYNCCYWYGSFMWCFSNHVLIDRITDWLGCSFGDCLPLG